MIQSYLVQLKSYRKVIAEEFCEMAFGENKTNLHFIYCVFIFVVENKSIFDKFGTTLVKYSYMSIHSTYIIANKVSQVSLELP